jgi:hypothetical protein
MPFGQVREYFDQVYFIRGANGLIKVGVSRNPVRRVRAMQSANACKLELLFYVAGSFPMEHEIHGRFSHLRSQGEWFEPADELLDFMRELWQHRQACRAAVMGYDKDKFYAILCAGKHDWTKQEYVDGALYRHGNSTSDPYGEHKVFYNAAAIEEFRSARLPLTPLPVEMRDFFTPKELKAWDNVLSTA